MTKQHLGLMVDHNIGDDSRPVAQRREEILAFVKAEYGPAATMRTTVLWSMSVGIVFIFTLAGIWSVTTVKTDVGVLCSLILLCCSWISILLTVIAHNTFARR